MLYNSKKESVMSQLLKSVCLGISFMLVCSCGINKSIRYESNEKYLGSERLYGNLSYNIEKFYFKEISNNHGDVLLNDVTPLFDINEQDCGTWEFNKPSRNNNKYCDYTNTHFRDTAISKSNSFVGTVGTMGTSVLMGLNYRYSYFKAEDFRTGVASAFVNSSFDRETLLNKYDKWLIESKKYTAEKDAIKFKAIAIDKTGFYTEKTSNEILSTIGIKTNSYFTLPPESVIDYLSSPSNLEYELDYKNNIKINGFDVDLSAVKKIPFGKHRSVVPVDILVKSKDFGIVFPPYEVKDQYLDAQFNGRQLIFNNMTKSFIRIMSLSIYHDKAVNTISLGELSEAEIAPETQILTPISVDKLISDKIRASATYNNITAEEAMKITVNFGFAIKYRVVEQNVDKTMYVVKKYNLYNILKDRA